MTFNKNDKFTIGETAYTVVAENPDFNSGLMCVIAEYVDKEGYDAIYTFNKEKLIAILD